MCRSAEFRSFLVAAWLLTAAAAQSQSLGPAPASFAPALARSAAVSFGVHGLAQEVRDEPGAPPRPRLGAEFHDVSPAEAVARGRSHAHGVLIEAVAPAGLRTGDIVVGMNGRAIGNSGDFTRALLAWRSAAGTRFTVFRQSHYTQLMLD